MSPRYTQNLTKAGLQVFVLAAGEFSPQFYATTTVVLLGLLITWLVGEARELREQLIAAFEGRDTASSVTRITGASLLAVAAMLLVGVVIALRAQYRGKVESWEVLLVWAALGAGLAGVVLSMATNVLAMSEITRNEALVRGLRVAKRFAPPAVALVVGLLASPLFANKQLVGATFAVYGTCLTGGCGLKQRSGPGANFPEVDPGDRLMDGKRVLVVCQAKGPPPKGYSNPIWDQLPNGRYVSDAFVETPNRHGDFSAGLPRCNPRAAEGTAG